MQVEVLDAPVTYATALPEEDPGASSHTATTTTRPRVWCGTQTTACLAPG